MEARRHGVVLVRPLVRAFAVAIAGAVLLKLPWPAAVPGALLMGVGAVLALAAVWQWDRTRLVVTTEKVVLEQGVVLRRESAVLLRKLKTVGLERSLTGRLLGYGTVVAGPLRISFVAEPREVADLLVELLPAAASRPSARDKISSS
jgi:uncharacterized membrane protein YdbT with pleckstrin-like domain